MGDIKTLEELEAWQACRTFRKFVSREIPPVLLKKKEFDLHNQLKRSSRSTTANNE